MILYVASDLNAKVTPKVCFWSFKSEFSHDVVFPLFVEFFFPGTLRSKILTNFELIFCKIKNGPFIHEEQKIKSSKIPAEIYCLKINSFLNL